MMDNTKQFLAESDRLAAEHRKLTVEAEKLEVEARHLTQLIDRENLRVFLYGIGTVAGIITTLLAVARLGGN